jgi:hypothetical protein
MDSGYFDDDIIETKELLGCKYLIKAKEYPTLVSQVIDPSILFVKGDEGRETDMAVGHLLLKSFWAKEAVFQMMMLAYNLFLLFKFDSIHISEYRQQIKTFRLKYIFLAAKIIRTALGFEKLFAKNYAE